jgi:hypothetical protein
MENFMIRGLLLFSLGMLLAPSAGCAPSLESKLIGRWRLDAESIDKKKAGEAMLEQIASDNEAAAGVLALAGTGMLETMLQNVQFGAELDFRPDHTLSSRATVSVLGQGREMTQGGTWNVESAGDNQLTVTIATDDGNSKPVVIKFLDDDTFTATGSLPGAGDQPAKFIRVPQS